MLKEDILRKRNLELAAENERLKEQLAEQERLSELANITIQEHKAIQDELLAALKEANVAREKYKKLMKEMQDFKKTVKGRNAIERWVFDLKRK